MSNHLNTIINSAKERINLFCANNDITTNILSTAVYSIDQYFKDKDQSGNNFSIEECYNDMDGSEAMMFPSEIDGKAMIIVDEEKLYELNEFSQIQIIIHEFLHLLDYNTNPFFVFLFSDNLEAEVEIISYCITLFPHEKASDAIRRFKEKVNPQKLLNSYDNEEIAKKILYKLKFESVTIDNFKERLCVA